MTLQGLFASSLILVQKRLAVSLFCETHLEPWGQLEENGSRCMYRFAQICCPL